jgi:hypothetical protein
MSRIITRLFDSFTDAEHAVIELERVGIAPGDISLVSHRYDKRHVHVRASVRTPQDLTAGQAATKEAVTGATVGGIAGAVGGALAGLGVLVIPGIGPVVAAGWLVSAAAGAVVGAAAVGVVGGLIGALTNSGVSPEEAHVYAEGVRRGGTLVSARVAEDKLAIAEAALQATAHVDLDARRQTYRSEGWSRFDEKAPAYSDEDIELERARR